MKRYKVKFCACNKRNIYVVYVSARSATNAYEKAFDFLYKAYGEIIYYCYFCTSVERENVVYYTASSDLLLGC